MITDRSTSLSPQEIAACLRATSTILRAELAALPLLVVSWHPAPGEWCVKQVLGHLIESEQRGFAGRIRTILSSDNPQLAAWDQIALAHERHDCDRDLADLSGEFGKLREESVALVAGLRGSDLDRGGYHSTIGYVRVGDLLHEWVYHEHNHIRQMLANVQDFVWPYLGNTQRFYQS